MTTNTTVSKLLSSGLLVSSSQFGTLTPNKQTQILAGAGGKPVVFVENFHSLRSTKNIIDKLLTGADASMEMEFNDITLSDAEKSALSAIRPVLEKIKAIIPPYKFAEVPENPVYLKVTKTLINNGNYNCGIMKAKVIWKKASAFWNGNTTNRIRWYDRIAGYNSKEFEVRDQSLIIGCQTIHRYQVEELAVRLGWDFPEEVA